ncbi:hypothetical protein ACWG5P_28335 [Streptomyces prasinus]
METAGADEMAKTLPPPTVAEEEPDRGLDILDEAVASVHQAHPLAA